MTAFLSFVFDWKAWIIYEERLPRCDYNGSEDWDQRSLGICDAPQVNMFGGVPG